MKRNCLVLLVLAVVMLSIVGCNGNVSEAGRVSISIDSSIPKGLESISMDTVEYGIVMRKGSSSEMSSWTRLFLFPMPLMKALFLWATTSSQSMR